MFPANLDTKDGQWVAAKATANWHLASVCLSDAARYMTMAAAHQMATADDADHWLDEMSRHLDRALAAIGYRMVPVDQPTPKEARRKALEDAAKVSDSYAKKLAKKSLAGRFSRRIGVTVRPMALQAIGIAAAIRALISEPSK